MRPVLETDAGRDDDSVPLICPTCQPSRCGPPPWSASAVGYGAWGCFRCFCLGAIAVSVWAQSVYAFAALKLRRTPRFALQAPHVCATQGAVVKKRDPLVYYRDDDLERALRKGLGPSALRRFRVCLPVVVLVFVRTVLARPERVLGSKQKLSVCDPRRDHENGEYSRSYSALHCWQALSEHRPVP